MILWCIALCCIILGLLYGVIIDYESIALTRYIAAGSFASKEDLAITELPVMMVAWVCYHNIVLPTINDRFKDHKKSCN